MDSQNNSRSTVNNPVGKQQLIDQNEINAGRKTVMGTNP